MIQYSSSSLKALAYLKLLYCFASCLCDFVCRRLRYPFLTLQLTTNEAESSSFAFLIWARKQVEPMRSSSFVKSSSGMNPFRYRSSTIFLNLRWCLVQSSEEQVLTQ